MSEWQGIESVVAREVVAQNERLLATYRSDPKRLEADANTERSLVGGAYARRQLFELVQNAVDAMGGVDGRCEVLLTDSSLYVANSGEPFTVQGVGALMSTHLSVKRDDRIGRFGLGFKSVLAVSDSPRIFSRSGSFGFDAQEAAATLSEEFPGHEHYPAMRLATPLNPNQHFRSDPILEKLAKWASTVVALPLARGKELLTKSVHDFPAEFLLFSPHVTRLDLEDRTSDHARRVSLDTDASGLMTLDDAGRKTRWVVVRSTHTPSREALLDGGYQAARSSVEMSWAAPIEGQTRLGSFWAYFPTADLTTLSGIVNAPWKLADDRESLLPGAFNAELLTEVLPRLVTQALRLAHSPDRPGGIIDLLPARGKEERSYGDDLLNVPVMKAVADTQSIPSMAGTLRHPTSIRLHPDDVTPDELELWAGSCLDPEWWVHHSINSSDRRARVKRLMAEHQKTPVTLKAWVEHLVKTPTVEQSATAVRLVAILSERNPSLRDELTSARVLLLEDGTLHACQRGQVFLPGPQREEGRLFIDSALAGDRHVEAALASLGIEILDEGGSLRGELSADPIRWEGVWPKARRLSVDEAVQIFHDTLGNELMDRLRVRAWSGQWRRPGRIFLPGPIVSVQERRDQDFLVHPSYHEQDLELLERLGVMDAPRPVHPTPTIEPWRRASEERIREDVRNKLGQKRLSDSAIEFDAGRIPWPMQPLSELSPEGRAAMARAVLQSYFGGEKWRVLVHGKAKGTIPDPTWSHLRRFGFLDTLVGPRPISGCLSYDDSVAVHDGVEQPLPFVVDHLSRDVEEELRLKGSFEDLMPEDWTELIALARAWEPDRRVLLYAWAALAGHDTPPLIRALRGRGHVDLPPNEVAVTASTEVLESLLLAQCPALIAAPQDAEVLQTRWGLSIGEEMLQETLELEQSGQSVLAVDRFPPLRNILEPGWHDLEVVPCSRLELLTSTPGGQVARPLTERLDGRKLFTRATDDRETLLAIGRALGIKVTPQTILGRMEEQKRNQLRVTIRRTTALEDKLVLAIGAEEMRNTLPQSALNAIRAERGSELDDREIAQLALAVDGYDVLRKHVAALRRNNLEPPDRWAGQREARYWVRSLGFSTDYAGFPGAAREVELVVEGPPTLGELHNYQHQVAEQIQKLLAQDGERRRGLVALPTGAGKTRVAAQALVEHMAVAVEDTRVIWIAETDELCEQAVQTWSQVWRAHGGPGKALSIARLWGNNEAEERDGAQTVVASADKLDAICRRSEDSLPDEYRWLTKPSIIVVDEAHRSIGPQYTRILSALGGTKRVAEVTTPLLGLTATPFRGWNDRETQVLAERYHKNRLEARAFGEQDVYEYLQNEGVLARVRHELLPGASLTLNPTELDQLKRFNRVPDTVEQRLGQNDERNNRIVASLSKLPEDSKALLFATSVDNARTLAALLSFDGVNAQAVSGQTDSAARRRYVEDFKSGKIRVLTNYNVFTEGFDVPSVDAVYITRPTFSPNVYQQMIGRGLRGPRNGGKKEVLVVNVEDNMTNFGDEFAFRHFEHLWRT